MYKHLLLIHLLSCTASMYTHLVYFVSVLCCRRTEPPIFGLFTSRYIRIYIYAPIPWDVKIGRFHYIYIQLRPIFRVVWPQFFSFVCVRFLPIFVYCMLNIVDIRETTQKMVMMAGWLAGSLAWQTGDANRRLKWNESHHIILMGMGSRGKTEREWERETEKKRENKQEYAMKLVERGKMAKGNPWHSNVWTDVP